MFPIQAHKVPDSKASSNLFFNQCYVKNKPATKCCRTINLAPLCQVLYHPYLTINLFFCCPARITSWLLPIPSLHTLSSRNHSKCSTLHVCRRYEDVRSYEKGEDCLVVLRSMNDLQRPPLVLDK